MKINSHFFTITAIGLLFLSGFTFAQEETVQPEIPAAIEETDSSPAEEVEEEKDKGVDEHINSFLAPVSNTIFKFVFAGPEIADADGDAKTYRGGGKITLPLILLWLVGSAFFLTIIFKFVNIRNLGLALKTVKGKYSDKDDPGEITHFQALSAALSGTVGLGNISGVAIAISVGGAGAVFWMVVAGILGMTTKFCECTLGVKYRKISKDGSVRGGAMYYLSQGLEEKGMKGLGKTMAILFAIVCIGSSVGAGNMFQVNQAAKQFIGATATQDYKDAIVASEELASKKKSYVSMLDQVEEEEEKSKTLRGELTDFAESTKTKTASIVTELAETEALLKELKNEIGDKSVAMKGFAQQEKILDARVEETKGFFAKNKWVFGVILAVLVGIVILGGIKSIAKVTEILVPLMCGIYVIAALIVISMFASEIPGAIGTIFGSAFGKEAITGGMIGAFIQGIRRAAFSNEAGFGSAPIAHSAVKTKHAASEGLVALLEPLVDTVFVCTITGILIVVTGMHETSGVDGVLMTSQAFEKGIGWFPMVLTASVILFAFSTMLSWSYYGQQACAYLFGDSKGVEIAYKLLFCVFIVIGAAASLSSVLDFSDGMFFFMCLFNLVGVWMLFPIVKDELAKFKKHVKEVDAK